MSQSNGTDLPQSFLEGMIMESLSLPTNQDSVQKDTMVKRNQETMLKRCLWLDQEHRKILKGTKP